MGETVIYPLSEETGLRILAALTRIAVALEGTADYSSSVDGDRLTINGSSVAVDGDRLVIGEPSTSVDEDKLVL